MIKDCTALDIEGEKTTTVHTDGEFGGKVKRVHYECLKGKLHMLC